MQDAAPSVVSPSTEGAQQAYGAPSAEGSTGAPSNPFDPGHYELNFGHGQTSPTKQPTISMAEAGPMGQPQGVAPGSEPAPAPTPDQGHSPFSTLQAQQAEPAPPPPIDYSRIPATPIAPPPMPSPIAYSEVPTAPIAPAPLGGQPTTHISSPPPEAYQIPQPAYFQAPPAPPPAIPMEQAGAWAQPQNPNAPLSSFVSVPASPSASIPEAPTPKPEPSFASMPPSEPIKQQTISTAQAGAWSEPQVTVDESAKSTSEAEGEKLTTHIEHTFMKLDEMLKGAQGNPELEKIILAATQKIVDDTAQNDSITPGTTKSNEENK